MKTKFFIQKHREDGELYFEVNSNYVRFYCRWPFDLSTDEWIYISNTFALEEYLKEVPRLSQIGKVTLPGIESGEITFKIAPNGKIKLSVIDAKKVSPPQLVDFTLEATTDDLVP